MSTRKHAKEESFSFRPFESLKETLERKTPSADARPVSATPANKNKPAGSDEEVFRAAMSEVREIREFREMPVHQKRVMPGHKYTSSDREAMKILEEIACGRRPVNLPDTQEYVEWVNPDYHADIIRKLRTGEFSIQASLDLHGFIVEEAEAEIEKFIRESLKVRMRCIKIIHGRGLRSPNGPVLKNALVAWLSGRHKKHLIAFVTARQCDGGLGALYILLR